MREISETNCKKKKMFCWRGCVLYSWKPDSFSLLELFLPVSPVSSIDNNDDGACVEDLMMAINGGIMKEKMALTR